MTFLMVLVATIVAVLALRQPLHKWPWRSTPGVVADVAYIAGIEGLLPRAVTSPLTLLMGKCMLSLALFVVVMYIGVFAKGSRAHQWLKPGARRAFHPRVHFGLRTYGGVSGLLCSRGSGARWGRTC